MNKNLEAAIEARIEQARIAPVMLEDTGRQGATLVGDIDEVPATNLDRVGVRLLFPTGELLYLTPKAAVDKAFALREYAVGFGKSVSTAADPATAQAHADVAQGLATELLIHAHLTESITRAIAAHELFTNAGDTDATGHAIALVLDEALHLVGRPGVLSPAQVEQQVDKSISRAVAAAVEDQAGHATFEIAFVLYVLAAAYRIGVYEVGCQMQNDEDQAEQ